MIKRTVFSDNKDKNRSKSNSKAGDATGKSRSKGKKQDRTSDTSKSKHTSRKSKMDTKEFSLVSVEGEPAFVGPKYFPNQIFVDVFDTEGRHDKVLENEDSVELFENFDELKARYMLVQIEKHEEVKEPPLQVQGQCFDFQSYEFGDKCLEDTLDLIKPLSVRRHLHTKK